jgi:O-antigen ligase
MQKHIYKLFNLPLWTILALVGLLIALPQLNNQDYIFSTITSKLIFFLYVILLLLGLYTLRFIFSKTTTFSFSKLDFALLLLLVYISLNRYFIQSDFGFSIRYLELLGLGFLYLVLRNIGLKMYPLLLLSVVISGIIQAVYGNLQLLGFCTSNHSGFEMTGSFFNPGPYAGFLSSVWIIALGMYLCSNHLIKQIQSQIKSNSPFLNEIIKHSFDYITLLGLISIALVLPATQSRAAWFASIVGSIILLEMKFNFIRKGIQKTTGKLQKIILILNAVIIIGAGLFGLYYYKKASSDGRAFIWKVTAEIISDNPIFGVGFDRFTAHYMNYQADFFAVHGETSEAVFADNVYYAYNEGLQFVAENGFTGLLLLLIVLSNIFQNKVKEVYQNDYYLAISGLITIGAFACFSYPMQILPIKIVLIVLVSILSQGCSTSVQLIIRESKIKLWAFKTSFLVFTIFIMYHTFSYTKNIKQGFISWNNAMNNYQFENYNTAILEFETAYPIFKKEGEFLTNYGKALSISGKHHKAILILEQTNEHQNNTIVATTLGDSYKATKQYCKAEACYQQAINMTPSKFYAPYLLAKLYDDSQQKEKAVALAQIILNKKIKVPSIAIEEIHLEMKKILSKY